MVPVNVRGGSRPGDLGNRISLLPVTIPLDIRNPRKLLAAVRERMEFLKRAHVAELVGLAGGLVGTTPTLLQAFAGPMASQLPITPFNLVCTNIPGPQSPLYLLGHKMLQWYPYVPVGGDMAVNCAVLSYNGTTYFGIAGDVHAAPDLNRLETFLRLSLEELRNAARGKGLRKKRSRAKAKIAPKSAPAPVIATTASTVRPSVEPAPAGRAAAQDERVPVALAAD
jgi:diacylglycerol O-acyltransferase